MSESEIFTPSIFYNSATSVIFQKIYNLLIIKEMEHKQLFSGSHLHRFMKKIRKNIVFFIEIQK